MTDDEIRETYRKIASRENPQGQFLTSFAETLMRSDDESFRTLREPAVTFIHRFRITPESKPNENNLARQDC
jgi:hypothetical protein